MMKMLFYLFALLSITGAVNVLIQRKTIHAAVSVIVCLASLSGIYFLLSAQFIGMIQLIIYAGAIMVLFVVVIMLLDPEAENSLRRESGAWILLCAALGLGLCGVLWRGIREYATVPREPLAGPNTQNLAWTIFRDYLLPFEAISILILTAIIGAVVLTKKRIR